MICELCTIDILRGTMYRVRLHKHENCNVCSSCRELVIHAQRQEVDEVEEHERWIASLALGQTAAKGTAT